VLFVKSKFNILNLITLMKDVQCGEKKIRNSIQKNLIPTVKHSDGSVLVWGCMSATGVGKLHIIDGIMDHNKYTSKF